MRIISGSWKTGKALPLHSHGLRSFRPFARKTNRHKDMPQKKETLALPPSAITTLLQSSLLPQEKKTCTNNNNLSSLLPGPRKQRPPPPHNRQKPKLSFVTKPGSSWCARSTVFSSLMLFLCTVWNQRRERWTRTVRVTPRTTFHEAADDGKMRVKGDEKKNSPHARTHASTWALQEGFGFLRCRFQRKWKTATWI
jgi:hypothetical protein